LSCEKRASKLSLFKYIFCHCPILLRPCESDSILELFRVVDDKLEGSGAEQEEGLELLRNKQSEARKHGHYINIV
jgi:hypothetical protein